MSDLSLPSDVNDSTLEQVIARQHYVQLRNKLVALQSASEPDAGAIDTVIQDLEKAQLAYKATHGLIGNNPIEDPRRASA